MESKDELKEIDIKNRACYYFDNIMRARDIDFSDFILDKKLYKRNMKIFWFMTFHTKTYWIQKTIAY